MAGTRHGHDFISSTRWKRRTRCPAADRSQKLICAYPWYLVYQLNPSVKRETLSIAIIKAVALAAKDCS